MQIELRSELVDRLLALPESGMGYQLVDLILTDGRVVPNVKVFNCEIADLPDIFRSLSAADIADVRLRPDRKGQN
ncbi:MAG: hypothetical protein K2Z80_10010 [Xanthobacteraceae bacterium]|nr:hypothetical protein [Xanthobacteraceae bacterium]